MGAARKNRWGHRDATMIFVAYRHGLRPAELVDLAGIRSSSLRGRCTFAGSSGARPVPIRSLGTSCEPCGVCSVSKSPSRLSCSRQSGARLSAPWVRPHGRAGRGGGQIRLQGAPPHAQARLRLRTSQQGARHEGPASVPRPPQHSAYSALY